MTPDLFHVWLGERWEGGRRDAAGPTGGLPFVFFYCINSALLAAKLSSVYMRLAAVQGLTTLVTVLCAAPFGLDATCLSLAIRPWVLLPYFLWLVRRLCHLPLYDCMRLPLRSLGGSIVMAGSFLLCLFCARLGFTTLRPHFARHPWSLALWCLFVLVLAWSVEGASRRLHCVEA